MDLSPLTSGTRGFAIKVSSDDGSSSQTQPYKVWMAMEPSATVSRLT